MNILTLDCDLTDSGTIPEPVVLHLRDTFILAREHASTLAGEALMAHAIATIAGILASQGIDLAQPITDAQAVAQARSLARATAREAARRADLAAADAEVATRLAAYSYWRWYDAEQQVSCLRNAIAGDPAPTPAHELLLTRLAGGHVVDIDVLAAPAQQ